MASPNWSTGRSTTVCASKPSTFRELNLPGRWLAGLDRAQHSWRQVVFLRQSVALRSNEGTSLNVERACPRKQAPVREHGTSLRFLRSSSRATSNRSTCAANQIRAGTHLTSALPCKIPQGAVACDSAASRRMEQSDVTLADSLPAGGTNDEEHSHREVPVADLRPCLPPRRPRNTIVHGLGADPDPNVQRPSGVRPTRAPLGTLRRRGSRIRRGRDRGV